MTEHQIETYKHQLLQERERVMTELNVIKTDRVDSQSSDDQSEIDVNNMGDEASNLFDRGRLDLDQTNLDRILVRIDRALAKIDEGTYGKSDIDGATIPENRLNVLPYATTTVDQEEVF